MTEDHDSPREPISHGILCRGVLKIGMRKSSAAAKRFQAPHPRRKGSVVKEEEQLYLVKKPANGAISRFRHHRPKDKRAAHAIAPETFDPATGTIDFSDNERGAINKLLSTNAYYRAHPWPAPFGKTTHRLQLGDGRDLSWIGGNERATQDL